MPVGVATSLFQGKQQADAARDAGEMQAQATREANALQKQMYDQNRADAMPWQQAGLGALADMQNADFKRDFTANDFQADPGYAFRMAEGQKALERSAAARGGLQSGGTMKALAQYGQNFASNEYNNAYNRFNADRDRRFGRLSSIAGMGQGALGMMNSNASNYGNQVGQNIIGGGNAQGAARMAQGQAWANAAQGVNQAYKDNQETAMKGASMMASMMSDERMKQNIKPAHGAVYDFMDRLGVHSYEYKQPEQDGEGLRFGPMAQEMEESELGQTLVRETPRGKMIDVHAALGAALAAVASLHDRVKALESGVSNAS